MTTVTGLKLLRESMRALVELDVAASHCRSAGRAFVLQRFDTLLSDEALARLVADHQAGGQDAINALCRRLFAELRYAWALCALGLDGAASLAAAANEQSLPKQPPPSPTGPVH